MQRLFHTLPSGVREAADATVDLASAPASSLKAVTPHATDTLPNGVCRALWIGAAGDVAMIAEDDTLAVTLTAVPAGSVLPVRAKAVRAAGTTASNIVALY
ncbi:hypothetical protein ACHMW4_19160 [Mesorhizobium sp. UC22_110]|uniref:spike base protein, RCAP_Rcc01079 family n=1 Tax=unclassified Mesorhizobium TaxID=325217 RepID=UPI00366EF498